MFTLINSNRGDLKSNVEFCYPKSKKKCFVLLELFLKNKFRLCQFTVASFDDCPVLN